MKPASAKLLEQPEVRALIRTALREDLGAGDLTTRLCVPAGLSARATLWAREGGILAGLPVFGAVFQALSSRVRVKALLKEGARFKAGRRLAELRGPARALLSAERVALNLLQRLSGVATQTAAYVAAARAGGPQAQVLDTRKTTPGLRVIEKYAVACGGGVNHRLRLDSAILVKDNHLKAAGSLGAALRLARRSGRSVELEVETLSELGLALAGGADCVLLDNFTLPQLRAAVARIRVHNALTRRHVLSEASGGITLKSIASVAATGVDRISVGALTHSVRALDLSLEFHDL